MRLTVLMLDLVFLITAFGVRTVVQRRRTGDTGWRLGRPASAGEAIARGSMFASGGVLGVALAVSEARTGAAAASGLAIAIAAIAFVSVAQLQMGSSWRIGVDQTERTDLIVDGLYALVRNPIYTGMATFTFGQVLLLDGPLAIVGAALMVLGVEVQVRSVEEPYLVATHGNAFTSWARRSGRFVPRLG